MQKRSLDSSEHMTKCCVAYHCTIIVLDDNLDPLMAAYAQDIKVAINPFCATKVTLSIQLRLVWPDQRQSGTTF